MNDNPYAPPTAVVADPDSQPQSNLERPRKVELAVRLLWTGFGVSAAASFYTLFLLPANAPLGVILTMTMIGLVVAGAISYGLFTAAWRGRGWARWVIAGLVVLGFIAVALMWTLLPHAQMLWVTRVSFVIRMTLYVIAVALLFSQPANDWYREKARQR